ncbi:MAG: protein kinase [Anaerolineales bacterium]
MTTKDLTNKKIRGYELVERIGTGGFGAVYRAHQIAVDREVAIKVILPDFANQPEFIRRFEAEAQVIARLEHPHIVPLHDYWRDPSGAYLVMRYLGGGSLQEELKHKTFSPEEVADLLVQISGALSLAHRNDIIHRDIKPGNILLDEDNNVYLADFGIAKDLTQHHRGRTRPNAIIGSLDYISPEQARNEPVTARTDIYSLGLVLYELLTGSYPFPEISSVERLYKHINDPLPMIDTLDSHYVSTINAIIQKATAKDPDQRYQDVLALMTEYRLAIFGQEAHLEEVNPVTLLTPREQEVLSLMVDGLSNRDIADRLVITIGTVKWYITQIYRKLQVRGRVQAIVRARELDLVVMGQPKDQIQHNGTDVFVTELDNPYKGLEAFGPADSQDYYGREELIDTLLARMAEESPYGRFLAVIGPSGSGKSSLVKAGLIPALWCGGLPDSESWFIADMLPGSRPIDELEVALTRFATSEVAGILGEHLLRDENGLVRVGQLILPDNGSELVVIVDQFEELFTLVDDEEMRMRFLNLLLAAVTDRRSRVRVIITLRADFYDRPLHYPEFGEMMRSRMETILPLSPSELERAIVKPAERVGVTFDCLNGEKGEP